ncbi:hypothetical protein E2C01_043052 [Portunus trituberculatus]|uniref:Uncharacterized protein n=1 Tax=Portunus trituberculatus TaxID=210409 RepID=A0A5B7FY64_PORTR|nr:hypothetical protein [Portunus trituberculatus]
MQTSYFKVRPDMMRMFAHNEAKTFPPKASQSGHPTIQHRMTPMGRSLQWVAPLVHWQTM